MRKNIHTTRITHDTDGLGQLLQIDNLILFALYSPCEGAKSIERFNLIRDKIVNLQTDRGAINWMIAGDWNADYHEFEQRYERIAHETGGQTYPPSKPTFRHRNRKLAEKSKIDFSMSNIRNIIH